MMLNVAQRLASVLLAAIACGLVCFLCAFSGCQQVRADGCVRARPYYGQTYYQHGYYYSPYYPYYAKEYVPQVLLVEVQRERYYSLSDLYRDRLYLELYDRLLERKPGKEASEPAADGRPAKRPATSAPTPAAAKKVLASSCVKCHKAGSDVDFTQPDLVSEGMRFKAHSLALTGEMPDGGKPITDDDVKALYEWAKAASVQARKR